MLTGRITKDSADVRRVTVDFITNGWLDTNEQISTITTPVIVVEQNAVWQVGAYIATPPPSPVDTTPMTLVSAFIVSGNQKVQLMLTAGTPGLTYKVTFVATTATSLRQKQIDLIVTIREPV